MNDEKRVGVKIDNDVTVQVNTDVNAIECLLEN